MRLLALGLVYLLLTACGFHLAGKSQIPAPLKTLYISSNQPYGGLTRQISEALRLRGVTLVQTPSEANYTLDMTTQPVSTTQTTTGSSQITRTYSLTLSATIQLKNNRTQKLARSFSLSASQSVTLYAGQILSNSEQEVAITQQLEQQLTESFFFYLNAQETREGLEKSSQVT